MQIISMPEISTANKSAPEVSNAAPFEALGFRKKRTTDNGETYYRAEMSDGQVHFLQVKTALEALHQATKLGTVVKVERSGLARLRMLDRDKLLDDEGDGHGQGLIKPGTVLITLATMAKLQAANSDTQGEAMPASAPQAEAAAMVPPPEASVEVAAKLVPPELHGLSPDEVEKLLSEQENPPEPLE